ncbi:AraC family transcriptional regulator [Marinobacter sp. X15-166B]|uniref:AraC family transcriptional regulator n=1 Tax=Marinobacter sp. X15-166B TaxID=1897620 RepID=UPI00085C0ECF|nr:AraC family transcriptional regulator [Marinobacter sp. X15-166B]OEY66966.1 transcriptional regulator [Marinobacter sp. X15-166B]
MSQPNTTGKRRNTLGDISILYVDVLCRAVRQAGQTDRGLRQEFGISQTLLQAPDARISIPHYMRLGEAAIALTGDPALGLLAGRLTRPVDLGMAGLAAHCAPTVGAALATLIRYSLLTSRNSRGHPSMSADLCEARFYSIRPYNRFNYFVVDSVLAAWTQLVRALTGTTRVLQAVAIEYPSQGLDAEFEAFFQCPVHFNAKHNGITLARSLASHPSVSAQPAMHRKLTTDCELALGRIRSGWTLQDRIKEKVAQALQGSAPRLESIAAELGMTPWTVQRQLQQEGSGYRQILDLARRDLAQDYIRETTLSLSEVSWLLGFSGPAAFHKAYQRWFGTSPGRHRADLTRQRAPTTR